jgi:hypothetical protein
MHSRVAMQSSLYQPPQRQPSPSNGIGRTIDAAQGQVGPRADTISNRTSLPSISLLPITNPGMASNRVNYQYDPVIAEGYDMPAMPLELQQHLTYMQPGYTQNLVGSNISKYNGRPMENTMAILSSEQYDDRGASRRPVRRQQEPMIPFGLVKQPQQNEAVQVRKTNEARQLRDSENGPGERRRKKQKLSSDDEGEDEAAKKARGRPRLDTKDETAADVSIIYFSRFAGIIEIIFGKRFFNCFSTTESSIRPSFGEIGIGSVNRATMVTLKAIPESSLLRAGILESYFLIHVPFQSFRCFFITSSVNLVIFTDN